MDETEEDEIVAEVRAVRQQLLADAGGDLRKLFDSLKTTEGHDGREVVTLRPKRLGDADGELG